MPVGMYSRASGAARPRRQEQELQNSGVGSWRGSGGVSVSVSMDRVVLLVRASLSEFWASYRSEQAGSLCYPLGAISVRGWGDTPIATGPDTDSSTRMK
jgi:hypothetical protein